MPGPWGSTDGTRWASGSGGWTAPRGRTAWAGTTPCRYFTMCSNCSRPDLARRLPEPVRPLPEPALQAFHNRAEPPDPPVVKLAVHFPPDGVTLKLSRWGRFRPVRLKTTGGAGPVRWLVNGRLLDGTVWQPEASGVVTLTALDARGHRARTTVQVK